jgi:hypothetical protein
MTAIGRKRPFISLVFAVLERPLSGKADIQPETSEIGFPNDRYTLQSGR